MKIEEGKFYKASDGRTVGPMEGVGSGQWFHHEGSKGGFRPDGRSFVGMDPDLIAPAYVEQGTLKELNLQPGDQLVFVEEGENQIGYNYQKGYLVEVEEDGTVYGCSPELCDATWRVVSRASDGPVRTVTRITTHGTWAPRGKMPKTQYVYEVEFDIDENGHPDWKNATVKGK